MANNKVKAFNVRSIIIKINNLAMVTLHQGFNCENYTDRYVTAQSRAPLNRLGEDTQLKHMKTIIQTFF